jgi:hypothetical protein
VSPKRLPMVPTNAMENAAVNAWHSWKSRDSGGCIQLLGRLMWEHMADAAPAPVAWDDVPLPSPSVPAPKRDAEVLDTVRGALEFLQTSLINDMRLQPENGKWHYCIERLQILLDLIAPSVPVVHGEGGEQPKNHSVDLASSVLTPESLSSATPPVQAVEAGYLFMLLDAVAALEREQDGGWSPAAKEALRQMRWPLDMLVPEEPGK